MLKEGIHILREERNWLNNIQDNLFNTDLLLKYAVWLSKKDQQRAEFIHQFVEMLDNQSINNISTNDVNFEWKEIIGFNLAFYMLSYKCFEFKQQFIDLCIPAFRIKTIETSDDLIPIGESKIGGLPDLPKNIDWFIGDDCKAIFNDETTGEKSFSGFLAQINLADFHENQTHLPNTGLLSFFCFQDIENDNPDKIGVGVFYFNNSDLLERKKTPKLLTQGNEKISSKNLFFEETFDFPESYESPWSNDFHFVNQACEEFLDHFRDLNFNNFLGYARATSSNDPTKNKSFQHLISLENFGEYRLHLQIKKTDLKNYNFENVILSWVDFD